MPQSGIIYLVLHWRNDYTTTITGVATTEAAARKIARRTVRCSINPADEFTTNAPRPQSVTEGPWPRVPKNEPTCIVSYDHPHESVRVMKYTSTYSLWSDRHMRPMKLQE